MAVGDVSVSLINPLAKRGAVFDGVDDVISIPHAEANNFERTQAFTASFWVKNRSTTPSKYILHKGQSTLNTSWYISTIDSTQIRLGLVNDNATNRLIVDATSPKLYDDSWAHFLFTYDGSSAYAGVKIYENGVSLATGNVVNTLSNTIKNTDTLKIGDRTGVGATAFQGAISKVKIWNRVLTAAEIAKDYAMINVEEGQILNIPLKDDYTDKSPLGLDGTNSGSVLTAVDDILAASLKAKRVGATDKYFVTALNGKLLNASIAES